MDAKVIISALVVTLIAGLSTGIGGLLSLFQRRNSSRFLSLSLGFSAGVMIYLSFVEILPEGLSYLSRSFTRTKAEVINILGFFCGVLIIALIDRLVPSADNPHELPKVLDMAVEQKDRAQNTLLRTGVLTAIAITIHNIPEGLATFSSFLVDPRLGLSIALAIAIHNIPEGIAVAVPIYFATGNKRQAFLVALFSGLSEMIGALIGLLLFAIFPVELMLGLVMPVTAGIMIYISFDELLPMAKLYGEHHLAIYGVLAGMAVMAFSLLFLP